MSEDKIENVSSQAAKFTTVDDSWRLECGRGQKIISTDGDIVNVVAVTSSADRIVQCVNAHDDLVEVIERYLSASTLAELDEANRLARAALAKAKGEA